jgi:hypothetical protein
VNKVHSTGSFSGKKYIRQNIVLTEEKPDEFGDRLGHSPHESQTQIAQQAYISMITV